MVCLLPVLYSRCCCCCVKCAGVIWTVMRISHQHHITSLSPRVLCMLLSFELSCNTCCTIGQRLTSLTGWRTRAFPTKHTFLHWTTVRSSAYLDHTWVSDTAFISIFIYMYVCIYLYMYLFIFLYLYLYLFYILVASDYLHSMWSNVRV